MSVGRGFASAVGLAATIALSVSFPLRAQLEQASVAEGAVACRALKTLTHLTITSADIATTRNQQTYCYVQGAIAPAIRFHVQLPLPDQWNGRFLMVGDGGFDGALDFADARVDEGYATANSNGGHDRGAEPGWSFAFNNRQAEIDYGYRAVHVSAMAAKTVINVYYGKPASRSYFEGCSSGGRQGLIEAQRYPADFDGIVAGAPANHFQAMHANRIWLSQRMFKDDFAGNPAFDADRDGVPESLAKLELLHREVLNKCDGLDGIEDGVIDDPLRCEFRPAVELAEHRCAGDRDGPFCFTRAQLAAIEDIYRGARDSKGVRIFKGPAVGSEPEWPYTFIPHAGNNLQPASDFANYLFYDRDPGVPPIDVRNITQTLKKTGSAPEYAWWEFNVDEVTSNKGAVMRELLDATDPDLSRFASKGKLLLYHGWSDAGAPPEPKVDYYKEVVAHTFGGSVERARASVRLFMVPGMAHCGGGQGPNEWDKLSPLVEWVERDSAPDYIVAVHRTKGVVDNDRKICAYPERAVYIGPEGGANRPSNWLERNFQCRR